MTLRNPYDFVRLEPGLMRRSVPPAHDSVSGWWGRLEGRITAETPIFIGHSGPIPPGGARASLRDSFGNPVIPGSTLKGVVRSVVEAVAPGCVRVGSSPYRLPPEVAGCAGHEAPGAAGLGAVCPACALFGFVAGSKLYAGRVSFDDAVADSVADHPPVWLVVLSSPKPQHRRWYATADNTVAGRKFYYHQPTIQTAPGRIAADMPQNQQIRPLAAGTVFRFGVAFRNLAEEELDLLAFALVLEPDMRHKVGFGKPAGLGSVRIELTRVERGNPVADLGAGQPTGGAGAGLASGQALHGEAAQAWARQRAAAFARAHPSGALDDLRRIWHWPPADVTYRYPTREWFRTHPDAPMSEYR